MRRRSFLQGMLASGVGLAWSGRAMAAETRRPLVVVVLRGGLDGLAAVPAVGDPAFAAARGDAGEGDVGPKLDDRFALHPSLAPWKDLYDDGDLLVAHSVGLPYAERSHFDAQDLLASGMPRVTRSDTGWVGRGLHEVGGRAAAIGASVPLLLRGPEGSVRPTSVDPTRRSRRDEGRMADVRQVLAGDPVLGASLEEALATRRTLDRLGGRARDLAGSVGTLARWMALPEGPQVACIELDGWDTHAKQEQVLERRLGELAEGVVAFKEADSDQWERTMVLVVTEFGRTVHGNGTGGTDHGVGGAAFVLGGAVKGGQVLADWRGLGAKELVEGRDLPVTTDLRGLFAGAMVAQLGLSEGQAVEVFPGAKGLLPVELA